MLDVKCNFMKRAFSFIEFSIIILIAAALIFGVMQANRVVKKISFDSAKVLTQKSIVPRISGLILWLETSLDESFLGDEKSDGKRVTIWKDISPQNVIKNHAIAASTKEEDKEKFFYNQIVGANSNNTSGPIYIRNGIGNIPTLRFKNDGKNSFKYLTIDRHFKNEAFDNIVLFMVVKYRSGAGHLFDRACTNLNGVTVNCESPLNTAKSMFGAYIDENGNLMFVLRDSEENVLKNSPYLKTGQSLQEEQAYVLTFERNYGVAFNAYVNGSLNYSANSSIGDALGGIALHTPKIMRGAESEMENLDVDISEIIFYSGEVTAADRDAVEEYLGKKYGIKISN
jgi:hypothetical protein